MPEVSELISGDKTTRRKILDEVYRKVQSETIGVEDLNCVSQLMQIVANDSVSTFREKAARILLELFSKTTPSVEQLREAYRLIAERFTGESIEETRLALVQLLNCCIKKNVEISALDPITNTVKAALNDSFHEIVICACHSVVELSKKPGFHVMSDYFAEPLLAGLKRKQVAVRVDCAQALSPVLASSTLLIPDLAARLFRIYSEDENPKLQLAVVTSVGNTAIEVTPSDHNFHHLLPILLTGKCSDFEVVQEQSEKLWNQLKKEHDSNLVKTYSQHLVAFCRNGSEDWTAPVRIHSAQLLFIVIKEMGPEMKEELSDVMELIVYQSGDGEASIISSALKSSEVIGKSCAPEAIKWLSELKEPFDVQILAAILKASDGCNLDLQLCLSILDRFENFSKNAKFLLDCVQVLLNLDVDLERLDHLLIILLSVGEESVHSTRSMSLLEHAAVRTGHQDALDMMQKRFQSVWNKLPTDEIASGDSNSRPWNILNFVVHRLEKVDATVLAIIHHYLVTNSLPDVKLRSFNLLTASMPKLSDCSLEETGIVNEVRSRMKWKAGRTAASIRSAAVLCMWSMLQYKKFQIFAIELEEFVKLVLPLVEDDIVLTRLTTTRILKLIFRQVESAERKMDDVFTALAGRADDVSREVRREALLTLEDIFVTSGKFGNQFREKFVKLADTLCSDEDQSTRQTAEGEQF